MTDAPYLLAIDQGTTSTRAMLFDVAGAVVAQSQTDIQPIYPQPGWVEHDANGLWWSVVTMIGDVIEQTAHSKPTIVAAGITNQRETTIIWDRKSGEPIYNAIGWQDRRTADFCQRLKIDGASALLTERTGLVLDPYFSASKIAWLLEHIDGARAKAERGDLAFGTVDSFLLWRLTDGKVHATDATNASRTALFNIHSQQWDDDLLQLFGVPRQLLPDVYDCAAAFGRIESPQINLTTPITGIAGDQQAAMIGQACFSDGSIKSTYGTGCFAVLNTGARPVRSNNGMLTTLAYRLGGIPTYALEGSIFVAGAAIQWLRDELKLIPQSADSERLAESVAGNNGVYFVPAFTGLGAPFWDPLARGAIFGLTRDTSAATITRACLEAMAYQTNDLLGAMAADFGTTVGDFNLRVDGGMAANDWLMQFIADILGTTIDRPKVHETTALGAAYLAGLGAGVYASLEDIETAWQLDRSFRAQILSTGRDELLAGWADAVGRVTSQR